MSEALTWINFTYDEFACKCGCARNEMDPDTIDALQAIRDQIPFPMIVSSGYRCEDHPIEAKKLTPGPHNTGLAVDIVCSGSAALMILSLALKSGEFDGFGLNQRGDMDQRFVHLDQCEASQYRPRPHIWSY